MADWKMGKGSRIVPKIVDSEFEFVLKKDAGADLGMTAVGVAENVLTMTAEFAAAAPGTIAAAGAYTGELINRTSDWLETKIPLGEVTVDFEGFHYQTKASPKARITAQDATNLITGSMDLSREVIHPRTHEGKAIEEWMATHIGGAVEDAENFLAAKAESSLDDEMPTWVKATVNAGAVTLPSAVLMVAPFALGRGGKARKKKKATDEVADATEQATEGDMRYQSFEDATGRPETRDLTPRSLEDVENYARYVDEFNTEFQTRITQKSTEMGEQSPLVAASSLPPGTPLLPAPEAPKIPTRVLAQDTLPVSQTVETSRSVVKAAAAQQAIDAVNVVKVGEAVKVPVGDVAKAAMIAPEELAGFISKTEAPLYELIHRVETAKRQFEDSLTFREKAILDDAVRLERERLGQVVTRNKIPLGEIITGQRGAADFSVFLAGLRKATKGFKAFKERLIKEKGKEYGPIAQELYEVAESSRAPKSRSEFYQEGKYLNTIGHNIWNATGGRAINHIRRYGQFAPSLRLIANRMEHLVMSERPIKADFYESVNRAAGHFLGQLDKVLAPALKTAKSPVLSSAYKKKELNQILEKVRSGDFTGPLGNSAREMRVLLDQMHTYARAVGLDIGHLTNYFPRMYNWKKIKKQPDKFAAVLQKHGYSREQAVSIIKNIVMEEGLLDISDVTVSSLRKTKKAPRKAANIEEARKLLNVPDSALSEFLNNNLTDVMARYISNVTHRVEWARRFGTQNEWLKMRLQDGLQELSEAGVSITRAEVKALTDYTYGLSLAMQKAYKPFMNRRARMANSVAASAVYAMTLPLATLSSLVEPVLMLATTPVKAMQAVPTALNVAIRESVRTVLPKIPKHEATKFAETIGKATDAASAERLGALFGGDVNSFNTLFFKSIGLHQWTRFVNTISSHVGKEMVKSYLKDHSKGKLSKRQAAILKDMGIDSAAGKDWIMRGASETDPFFESVRTAAQRFSSRIVMHPRAAVAPLWHSDPHFMLLKMLKGFPVTFGNTVMRQWHEQTIGQVKKGRTGVALQNAALVAGTGTAMITVAMWVNELRDQLLYGDRAPQRSQGEKLWRAIDRTGFTGIVQTAVDSSRAKSFGGGALDPILGPFYAKAGRIATGAWAAVQGEGRPLARELVTALPYGAAIPKKTQKRMVGAVEHSIERTQRKIKRALR